MIRRRKPIKRSTKPIRIQRGILKTLRIGQQSAKGKLKAQQRLAYKRAYCKAYGRKEEGLWGGPCQSCGSFLFINAADFSHKIPAGRGGDVGGKVQATNGIYSCRPCHNFVEGDAPARLDLISSPANSQDGGIVDWSQEVYKRLAVALTNKVQKGELYADCP